MSEISSFNNGDIFIETTDVRLDRPISRDRSALPDAPAGSVPIGTASERIEDALGAMRKTIGLVANHVKDALNDHGPDEWSVEFSVGFSSEGGVPFVAKGGGSAAISVRAQWRKSASG